MDSFFLLLTLTTPIIDSGLFSRFGWIKKKPWKSIGKIFYTVCVCEIWLFDMIFIIIITESGCLLLLLLLWIVKKFYFIFFKAKEFKNSWKFFFFIFSNLNILFNKMKFWNFALAFEFLDFWLFFSSGSITHQHRIWL